eukprot:15147303-Ditylum_brightwellii.AAC.1
MSLQLPQLAQSPWKSQQISTMQEKKSIKTSSDCLPVEDYVDVSCKTAKTTKEAKLSSSRTINKTKA